jgi:proline iminopeptidase
VPTLQTRDGRTLAWSEAGSGPVLLCHPGGPGGSGSYFGGLPGLAAERTLLLLDPRGTGSSDRPSAPYGYDLSDYVDDVEAVREHVGLDRLDLLGHSHGGFVAMAWAAAHPDRVGRLVLSNTAARFTDVIRARRHAIVESHAGEEWYSDAVAALDENPDGVYADDAELAASLQRRVPFYFPRWHTDAKALATSLLADGLRAEPLSHFNANIAGGMDLRAGLGQVTAPTLVITGEDDPFGEDTAREIAAALPHATVVVIPDAGHFIFAESASRERWARAILDFLAE